MWGYRLGCAVLVMAGVFAGCTSTRSTQSRQTRLAMKPPGTPPTWLEKGSFYQKTREGLVLYGVGVLVLEENTCPDSSTIMSAASNRARAELSKLAGIIQQRTGKLVATSTESMSTNVRANEAWFDGDRTVYVLAEVDVPGETAGIEDTKTDRPSGGRAKEEVGGWVRQVYGPLCE